MPQHSHRTLISLQLPERQKQSNSSSCPVPSTRHLHTQLYHKVHHYQKMPQGGLVRSLTIQAARSAIRHVRPRFPMHQRSHLRDQLVGIYAKSQRTLHRENGAANEQNILEQTHRQPRVRSMRLDRARHLLCISPIRIGTKRIG